VPLNTLLNASHKQFHGAREQDHYATSWAFIYFLMDNPVRRGWLASMLRYEMANSCDVALNVHGIKQATGLTIAKLQNDFSNWMRSESLTIHHY
jgi:hypothetical protein